MSLTYPPRSEQSPPNVIVQESSTLLLVGIKILMTQRSRFDDNEDKVERRKLFGEKCLGDCVIEM